MITDELDYAKLAPNTRRIDELHDAVPFQKWKDVLRYGRPWKLPWPDESMGFMGGFHGDYVNDDVFAWFKERGYLPYVFETRGRRIAVVAPVVFSDATTCFHTTPKERASEILDGESGLLSGRRADRSTSLRQDAARFIHVSLNVEDAVAWGENEKLLRKEWSGKAWSILEIDLGKASLRVFRDPQSVTGYIVDAEYVPRSHVKFYKEIERCERSSATTFPD